MGDKINANDPAFPATGTNDPNIPSFGGLTIRQHLASLAMQGILASHWCQNNFKDKIFHTAPSEVARQSLLYADALIEELNK